MEYDRTAYGETWAPIYDEHHGTIGDDSTAVDFMVELAGDGPVLEFAIGTGRVAIPLVRRGLEVHGIDVSPSMLDRLRAKPEAASMTIVEGDMATASAGRRDFSVVLLVANTLFTLLDQRDQVQCFRNAAAHLRPGGCFLVDAFVPDLGRFRDDRHLSTQRVLDDAISLEASTHDPVAQIVRSQQVRLSAGGVTLLPVTIRYAWPSELDLMAELAGFTLEGRYGGWNREEFTRWSPFHVSVYRKPGDF